MPDNLKTGITKPSRYEPGINRTYQDLADHYGCVVLPTRIVKPRDKAKVEVAVQIVERFVLAKLRNVTFFSLAELNVAIRACVAAINAKVMRRVGKSRAELLETLDRPALKRLPNEPYPYAEWKRARVAPDYHIDIEDHFYSVPSKLIREIVVVPEARFAATRASPPPRSRSSTKAIALRATPSLTCATGTRRLTSICRAHIAVMPSGRRQR